MINETGNTENTDFTDEGYHAPFENQSGKSQGLGQVKELGRKGLEPLIGVLSNHKGEFSPYIDALTKALNSAAQSLEGEGAGDAEKTIAPYFKDTAEWLVQWKDKLSSQSPKDLLRFLEDEGRKRPAVLFGVSYFGGLLLGRFGRHLGKTMKTSTENIH